MSNVSETGHAKNVANFEKLVVNVSGLGAAYNPSRGSIQLSALNDLLGNAKKEKRNFFNISYPIKFILNIN